MNDLSPIARSCLRVFLGKLFYRYKRHFENYFSNKKFASKTDKELLPNSVFFHQTPLLRSLKDVDMWMQHNKVVNIQIAIMSLNGLILRPGETFSYWKLIGNPSERRGYLKGMVLYYGRFFAGTGGGLCQLSNIIYWITLHTPLTVIERHRHSYDVFPDSNRTQPFGSGATCAYNYRDLQILNDTNETFQLQLYLSENFLCAEWRATNKPKFYYEVYEREHYISHEIWGGYTRNNKIFRKILDENGKITGDEYVAENHAIMMYQPFICEKSESSK